MMVAYFASKMVLGAFGVTEENYGSCGNKNL